MERTIHEGRNVKRIREILGIKQDALAAELGLSQQAVSSLEQRESLDREVMEKVAKVLKVPAEAIRKFNEELTIQNIQNNYDNSVVNGGPTMYDYSFNPMEKYIESVEENKKLYERLLKAEQGISATLEKLVLKLEEGKN